MDGVTSIENGVLFTWYEWLGFAVFCVAAVVLTVRTVFLMRNQTGRGRRGAVMLILVALCCVAMGLGKVVISNFNRASADYLSSLAYIGWYGPVLTPEMLKQLQPDIREKYARVMKSRASSVYVFQGKITRYMDADGNYQVFVPTAEQKQRSEIMQGYQGYLVRLNVWNAWLGYLLLVLPVIGIMTGNAILSRHGVETAAAVFEGRRIPKAGKVLLAVAVGVTAIVYMAWISVHAYTAYYSGKSISALTRTLKPR